MGDIFGKKLKKQTARAKEKLMEGLGMAKATQDDVFDLHAANFVKQCKAVERFQRDLKNYSIALKAYIFAQKALRETIRNLYEPNWPDREHLSAITQSLDIQWEELDVAVNDLIMGSVTAYMNQFADLKPKVAKRDRKLVDFDVAKNTYTAIKADAKRAENDPKLMKSATDLQKAETIFQEINNELNDTLPATYDSRITFFVDTLQTFFNADNVNNVECAKYNRSLITILDRLGNSFESLRVPRYESSASITNVSGKLGDSGEEEKDFDPSSSTRRLSAASNNTTPATVVEKYLYPSLTETEKGGTNYCDQELSSNRLSSGTMMTTDGVENVSGKSREKSTNPFDDQSDDELEVVCLSDNSAVQTSTNTGRKMLCKVRATHLYTAEDDDELTINAGDIILVLEATNEDSLDEGWLMGQKESDGKKGVFPANFTRPL